MNTKYTNSLNFDVTVPEDVSQKFVPDANRKPHKESHFQDFSLKEYLPL